MCSEETEGLQEVLNHHIRVQVSKLSPKVNFSVFRKTTLKQLRTDWEEDIKCVNTRQTDSPDSTDDYSNAARVIEARHENRFEVEQRVLLWFLPAPNLSVNLVNFLFFPVPEHKISIQ